MTWRRIPVSLNPAIVVRAADAKAPDAASAEALRPLAPPHVRVHLNPPVPEASRDATIRIDPHAYTLEAPESPLAVDAGVHIVSSKNMAVAWRVVDDGQQIELASVPVAAASRIVPSSHGETTAAAQVTLVLSSADPVVGPVHFCEGAGDAVSALYVTFATVSGQVARHVFADATRLFNTERPLRSFSYAAPRASGFLPRAEGLSVALSHAVGLSTVILGLQHGGVQVLEFAYGAAAASGDVDMGDECLPYTHRPVSRTLSLGGVGSAAPAALASLGASVFHAVASIFTSSGAPAGSPVEASTAVAGDATLAALCHVTVANAPMLVGITAAGVLRVWALETGQLLYRRSLGDFGISWTAPTGRGFLRALGEFGAADDRGCASGLLAVYVPRLDAADDHPSLVFLRLEACVAPEVSVKTLLPVAFQPLRLPAEASSGDQLLDLAVGHGPHGAALWLLSSTGLFLGKYAKQSLETQLARAVASLVAADEQAAAMAAMATSEPSEDADPRLQLWRQSALGATLGRIDEPPHVELETALDAAARAGEHDVRSVFAELFVDSQRLPLEVAHEAFDVYCRAVHGRTFAAATAKELRALVRAKLGPDVAAEDEARLRRECATLWHQALDASRARNAPVALAVSDACGLYVVLKRGGDLEVVVEDRPSESAHFAMVKKWPARIREAAPLALAVALRQTLFSGDWLEAAFRDISGTIGAADAEFIAADVRKHAAAWATFLGGIFNEGAKAHAGTRAPPVWLRTVVGAGCWSARVAERHDAVLLALVALLAVPELSSLLQVEVDRVAKAWVRLEMLRTVATCSVVVPLADSLPSDFIEMAWLAALERRGAAVVDAATWVADAHCSEKHSASLAVSAAATADELFRILFSVEGDDAETSVCAWTRRWIQMAQTDILVRWAPLLEALSRYEPTLKEAAAATVAITHALRGEWNLASEGFDALSSQFTTQEIPAPLKLVLGVPAWSTIPAELAVARAALALFRGRGPAANVVRWAERCIALVRAGTPEGATPWVSAELADVLQSHLQTGAIEKALEAQLALKRLQGRAPGLYQIVTQLCESGKAHVLLEERFGAVRGEVDAILCQKACGTNLLDPRTGAGGRCNYYRILFGLRRAREQWVDAAAVMCMQAQQLHPILEQAVRAPATVARGPWAVAGELATSLLTCLCALEEAGAAARGGTESEAFFVTEGPLFAELAFASDPSSLAARLLSSEDSDAKPARGAAAVRVADVDRAYRVVMAQMKLVRRLGDAAAALFLERDAGRLTNALLNSGLVHDAFDFCVRLGGDVLVVLLHVAEQSVGLRPVPAGARAGEAWTLLQELLEATAASQKLDALALRQRVVVALLAADPDASLPLWLTEPIASADPAALPRALLRVGRPERAAALIVAHLRAEQSSLMGKLSRRNRVFSRWFPLEVATRVCRYLEHAEQSFGLTADGDVPRVRPDVLRFLKEQLEATVNEYFEDVARSAAQIQDSAVGFAPAAVVEGPGALAGPVYSGSGTSDDGNDLDMLSESLGSDSESIGGSGDGEFCSSSGASESLGSPRAPAVRALHG